MDRFALTPTPLAARARPSLIRETVGRGTAIGDARWDALLVCLAIYLLTAVGRVHQLFPVLSAAKPALLMGGAAVILLWMDDRRSRRFRYVWGRTAMWMALFLTWMIVAIPTALSAGDSFQLVFGNVAKSALLALVTAAAIRGPRDVERLTLTYLLAAALYAAIVMTRFDVGASTEWRLGDLYYYDANDFATLVVTALPIGLYFASARQPVMVRSLAGASLVVLTLAFVRTGSRGGFLALLAVGLFVVCRFSAIPVHRRLGAALIVGVIAVGAGSTQYWQQMGTILSDTDYSWTDPSGRAQIWRRGLGYIEARPLFGVGPGNFPMAEGTISPLAAQQQFGVGVRWNAAHNSYIQVGAELGVPGLLIFVALSVSAFKDLTVTRPDSLGRYRRLRELTQAMMAALLGFVVGAFFLSLAYSEMLFALLAISIGLRKVWAHLPPA